MFGMGLYNNTSLKQDQNYTNEKETVNDEHINDQLVFVNETFENALKTNNTEESLQDNIQDVLENNQGKDIIEELDDNAFAIFDFIVKTSHND